MLAIALATAVCSFALPRPAAFCEDAVQYTLVNGSYVLAGVFGEDYTCADNVMSTCTYVRSGSQYVPCRRGVYQSTNPPK